MGIFDWKHWLVILLVVVLIFGTKRLKTLGSDLGATVKGFRKAMAEDENDGEKSQDNGTSQAPLQNSSAQSHVHKAEESTHRG